MIFLSERASVEIFGRAIHPKEDEESMDRQDGHTLMPDHPVPFPDLFQWRGWMIRAIDGDTYAFKIDVGFRVSIEIDVRLLGVDTPEVVGEEREAGLAAKYFVEGLLPIGTPVIITTQRMRRSFNRYLATVSFQAEGDWIDLGRVLIDSGHGRPA